MVGYAHTEETYPNADALFSKLISSVPLPLNGNEGGLEAGGAHVLRVLGFNGTQWLGDKLKSTSDGSVVTMNDVQTVTFGARTPLVTHIVLRNGSGFPDGYYYTPTHLGSTLKKFEIVRILHSSDSAPTYTVVIQTGANPSIHTARLVTIKYGKVPDSIFRYPDVNGSVFVIGGTEDLDQIVNGKRVRIMRPTASGIPKWRVAPLLQRCLFYACFSARFSP